MLLVKNVLDCVRYVPMQGRVIELYMGRTDGAWDEGWKIFFPGPEYAYLLGPGWDITKLPKGLVVIGEISEAAP